MNKHLIIDRFEGEWCICEYAEGKTIQIPKRFIPADAAEGDVLFLSVDREESQKRRDHAEALRRQLFKK